MTILRFPPARLLALFLVLLAPLAAQRTETSLGGEWRFALDPVGVGVAQEWFAPGMPTDKWDKVTVPHCWSVDPRHHSFTGNAWYVRKFSRPAPAAGTRTFLRFEAVFYRCEIWLNGRRVGEHEGGYTPFEFDVTDFLADENLLAVRANNAWDTTTIPGAKTKVAYQSLNYGQVYPWMNYGGITREVTLVSRPEVYLERVRIRAVPDLAAKTARLTVTASVRGNPARREPVKLTVSRRGEKIPLVLENVRETIHPDGSVDLAASLARADVVLWSFDDPVLYEAELTLGRDMVRTKFGIRSIEVRGTRLLLNGEPVSLGGCNRPLDAPGVGSMDPAAVLTRDLTLIKAGGMELSRISHYPVSTQLLDWADEHGLLIVGEAGNWQMTPEQMADPAMRAKFRAQMQEMIERDWNHPSVIGWSMGNEYPSHTPEGIAWTKDMGEFAKTLDPTRLVTFASNMVARPPFTRPEAEASQHVDFVSVNIYDRHLEHLRWIHAVYPDKPIYVSEMGQRADAVANEQQRVEYLQHAMVELRQCADFLIGASVWTFNDYESMFPGSNANGYRPWGLVAPDRTPRAMYFAWQEEFAPATLAVQVNASGQLEVKVTARDDFPRYTLRHYRVRARGQSFAIDTLAPGAQANFVFPAQADGADDVVVLEKPGGFAIISARVPAAVAR